MTYQKIERGRGLGVADEGDIASNDNEYAVGKDRDNEPLAEDKDDNNNDEYTKDSDITDNNK